MRTGVWLPAEKTKISHWARERLLCYAIACWRLAQTSVRRDRSSEFGQSWTDVVIRAIDVINVFLRFLFRSRFLRFLTFFIFPRFLFLKKRCQMQSINM